MDTIFVFGVGYNNMIYNCDRYDNKALLVGLYTRSGLARNIKLFGTFGATDFPNQSNLFVLGRYSSFNGTKNSAVQLSIVYYITLFLQLKLIIRILFLLI